MSFYIVIFISIVYATNTHTNSQRPLNEHFQIVSNEFDSININIDYTQYTKMNDNILHTATNTFKYKLQQNYNGIPIFGATLVVEEDPSEINHQKKPIFGKYYNKIAITQHIGNTLQQIDKKTAIDIILNEVHTTEHTINYIEINSYIYYNTNHIFYLIWLIYVGYMNTKEALAIINAKNGDIMKLEYITINAVSNNELCGDGGNINIGKYTYCDHSLQIEHTPYISNQYFIMINNTEPYQCTVHENSDICTVSDVVNGAYCVVCDAYYHLIISFEIYLNWMNLLPFAIEIMPIYVQLHGNISNARYTYNGNHSMIILGDGDEENTFPWVSLDIVAHEVAHGFSDKAAHFIKFGESLAIEEAYSDLVGECTEYYLNGYNDWQFGADIMKQKEDVALRILNDSFINNYKINNKTLRDLSRIYNKAFYILNTKYNWSMKQLFKIISFANLYYWTSDSTLNEGLCGIYEVINDLYGDEIQQTETMINELSDAFNDVGIQCIVSGRFDVETVEIDANIEYVISGNKREFKYYTFTVNGNEVDAISYIRIRLESCKEIGDADLYILRDIIPNDSDYECRSNHIGNNEECVLWPKLNKNEVYYVMIYAFDTFKDVILKWNIMRDHSIELMQIEFNVPFRMRSNEVNYFYVVLSEFDYKIGSYLCLHGLSSNAVGYLQYETMMKVNINSDCCDVINTKKGTYYIMIETNEIYDEDHEFVVSLEYKHIFEIRFNEIIVITSNDWNHKYLYFKLESLDDLKQLKLSLYGGIIQNGAIDLYNDDGLILCSNECVLNVKYLYIGVFYIKYYGFIEKEIVIDVIHKLSWNIVPDSSLYALPIQVKHENHLIYGIMDDIIYLFDDEYIYKWNGNKWNQNMIENAPKWSVTSSQNIYSVVNNRFIYIFIRFTEIYKFDIEYNAFIENDIVITDHHYQYLCIASDEMNNDMYFIGNKGHPLLVYNVIQRTWIFGANIDTIKKNERILCAVSSTMLFAFIPQQQQIYSYTKQYDFWYLFHHKLTMNNIQKVLKTEKNILYLFGGLKHIQSIQILDINRIEYYNETDLNLINEILLVIYSSAKQFIVWSKYSIETTQNIDNITVIKNDNVSIDSNNTFLNDVSSMGMLGISYISIAIILISCQRKAILQRKELRQKSRKNKDIEHL